MSLVCANLVLADGSELDDGLQCLVEITPCEYVFFQV